jgi:hypothetical protein
MRPVFGGFLALAAALSLGSAVLYADDASKEAKIEEMFRITKVDQMQTQMMEQMKGVLGNIFDQPGTPAEVRNNRKELEDEVFAIIRKRVSWEKMRPEFVRAYSETLTEPELDSILAFYKTPGGMAILEKMPTLMKKGIEIGQAQMKDVVPEVQQTVERFVERHKTK